MSCEISSLIDQLANSTNCYVRKKIYTEKPYINITDKNRNCYQCKNIVSTMEYINSSEYNIVKIWKNIYVFCNHDCYNNWVNSY